MTPPATAHGIMAHYFTTPGARRVQGALTLEDWERGLDAYGPRLISARDWIRRALDGTVEDAVCVTVDDGLREGLVALPSLTARGLTAAWNLYTQPYVGVLPSLERDRWMRNQFASVEAFYDAVDAILETTFDREKAIGYLADYGYLSQRDREFRYWRDRWATPTQYERLMDRVAMTHGLTCSLSLDHWLTPFEVFTLQGDGHLIGNHSHSHPMTMHRLPVSAQILEYATAQWILDHLAPIDDLHTVSYPCGSTTPELQRWLQVQGYQLAWGATMDGTIPWTTPRWSTGYWTR